MTDSQLPVSRKPVDVTTTGGRKLRMTRRVRAAIDAMVWQGLKRDAAAQTVGMKDNSLYVALQKPDVRAYYLDQCEVLRVSGRARRIHRLEAISEQDENKQAAVNATRALENMGDDAAAAGGVGMNRPGLVIVVVGGQPQTPTGADHARTIDLTPCDGPMIEDEQ